MKIRIATGLIILLAACSGSEPPTAATPAGPSFDGNYVIGSGNHSDSTSTGTTNPGGNTSAADSQTGSTAGTYVIGSGN